MQGREFRKIRTVLELLNDPRGFFAGSGDNLLGFNGFFYSEQTPV